MAFASRAHLSGSFWSVTVRGHVVYESRLELARLLVADFDPLVTAMWPQPCRLVATVDGTQRHLAQRGERREPHRVGATVLTGEGPIQ
ncbi:hypothetical protein WEI85_24090 [Actinomycetes bacterium KLBMP 9797]